MCTNPELTRALPFCAAASLVLAALAAAATKRIRDATDDVAVKRRALRRAMRGAGSYQEFAFAAVKLEAINRRTPLLAAAEAAKERRLYDAQLLRDRMHHLKCVWQSAVLSTTHAAILHLHVAAVEQLQEGRCRGGSVCNPEVDSRSSADLHCCPAGRCAPAATCTR